MAWGFYPGGGISIHAPREGSDANAHLFFICVSFEFLSTLPARGATVLSRAQLARQIAFLSTLPARGATTSGSAQRRSRLNFYPRSPRGERRMAAPASGITTDISIHAPREGSDMRQG